MAFHCVVNISHHARGTFYAELFAIDGVLKGTDIYLKKQFIIDKTIIQFFMGGSTIFL